jgi:hypothetical protein
VSGNSITYDGSPVRLHGVATEDVYDLYLEGRDPEAEYARMANNWRANVVRISVHPSTWRYHETESSPFWRSTSRRRLAPDCSLSWTTT